MKIASCRLDSHSMYLTSSLGPYTSYILEESQLPVALKMFRSINLLDQEINILFFQRFAGLFTEIYSKKKNTPFLDFSFIWKI